MYRGLGVPGFGCADEVTEVGAGVCQGARCAVDLGQVGIEPADLEREQRAVLETRARQPHDPVAQRRLVPDRRIGAGRLKPAPPCFAPRAQPIESDRRPRDERAWPPESIASEHRQPNAAAAVTRPAQPAVTGMFAAEKPQLSGLRERLQMPR